MVVAGGHLTWINRDALSSTFDRFGPKTAVVGFLLVSGYSIAASLELDDKSFYLRRFKRIYPLYFFSLVMAVVLELWLGRYVLPNYIFEPTGSLAAFCNLIFLQTFLVKPIAFDGVVWSLAVEVSYYVAGPYLRNVSLTHFAVLIFISAIFFLLPRSYDGGQIYVYFLKMNAVKYFWPFAMGFILYHQRSTALTTCFGLTGTVLVWMSDENSSNLAVVTFILSFLIFLAARSNMFKRVKFLDYLGDVSYPLYLVQIPVYVIAYKAFVITNTALLLTLAIAASSAIYELIDVRFKNVIFKRPAQV